MSRKRLLVTSAGTISCALAIGFFMQQSGQTPGDLKPVRAALQAALSAPEPISASPVDAAGSDFAAPPAQAPDAHLETAAAMPDVLETAPPMAADDAGPATAVDFDKITLTSVGAVPVLDTIANTILERPAPESAITDSDTPLAAPSDPNMPRLGCEIVATARPGDMATVELVVEAPCNRNERLTIHHTGMIFTGATSPEGKFRATVPALAENAIFIAQFDSGKGAVMSAQVSDLTQLDRIALQWTGDAGFQIHAREYGAAYGSPGHVWSGSSTTSESGGTLVRLGDSGGLGPNIVEIYTFPTAQATRAGKVAVTIEAEVTATNCGRDIAAQSIETHGGGQARTQDLILSMPDCSAVGDFLVLNNLVDDLKIAAR